MSQQTDLLSSKLGERGLRTTKARLIILSHLSKRNDHPTADSILRALKESEKELGPATLYQNLGKLADAGLITRLTGPDGLMHFDPNISPHPHLACLNCGRIVDAEFDRDLFKNISPSCPHTGMPLNDWQLEEVQIELQGICPDCQKN